MVHFAMFLPDLFVDDVPHSGASAWGEPVDYGKFTIFFFFKKKKKKKKHFFAKSYNVKNFFSLGNGDDESGGRFKEDEFPAVGSQPVRRSGQARDYAGRGDSHEKGGRGGYSERDGGRQGRGYSREDREEGRGPRYGRERSDDRGDYYEGRSGDRSNRRERGYDERDTYGGPRSGSYGNREYGNREGRDRDRGFGGREREDRAPVPFPTSPPWTAHVGNLPYDVRKDELEKFFEDKDCKVRETSIRVGE